MSAAAFDWRSLHGSYFAGARVCVTGGAGFIGSHLVEALNALGADVVVLDDFSGGSPANLQSLGPISLVQGSILDRQSVAQAIDGCRYLFHLAALGSVPASVEKPRLYHEVNATGTLNMLEAARQAGVRRAMFAASSSAYGTNPVPWVESMPSLPMSPYAATKAAGEALLRAYAGSLGLDCVSLRYFNIFGPRQNANSAYAAVIAAFAKSMLAGKPAVIYGDGEQSRDFTFVRNAVHANLLAARAPSPLGGQVVNVGSGAPISVNALERRMAATYGVEHLAPEHKPERLGDLRHSYADLTRARDLLGFTPLFPFDQGLHETLAWYRAAIAR